MEHFNAYGESVRITKIIFNAIYAKEFGNRNEFDGFVTHLLKSIKPENAEYTYYSLYLLGEFTIHVNVVIDNCFSPTTLGFNMIWDDKGFTNENYTDNVSIYIGTPAYWFGRNEQTNINMKVKDEIKVTI